MSDAMVSSELLIAFQDTALDQRIRELIASGETLHRQRMTYRETTRNSAWT